MTIPTVGTNVAGNPLDVLNNFVGSIGSFVSQAFREMVLFLHSINIIFLDASFILICLLFFLSIFACIYLPIKVYPYFLKAKELYYKFFGHEGPIQ